jgi:hypothetical protein
MATTKNHPITGTLKKAIDYAMGDKVEEVLKDDLKDSVAYVIDDETGKVIYPTIHSTLNCDRRHPYEMFSDIIHTYGEDELRNGNPQTKDGAPILAWHYHQNFEGHVDPVIANEIGRKLAEEVFKDFAVVIGTHTNTENIHNHIIICAWNMNGKKWNQCNRAYQHIREVSDRLCEEYGLSVLRDTQKQKLVKFKDKDGNTHYYEPTERKNNLIDQRDAGEISTDDIGSYRNTIPYEQGEHKKEANYEIIKRDIDRLLPMANSYEHLLQMLRQIGYAINDKKKNGEWLKHISFQPPTADKGTRDYKIDDSGFYLRENLEQVIAEFVAERATVEDKTPKQEKKMPPYFSEYVYGETILVDIDENVRTVREKDGSYSLVERGETEKAVIRDVKAKDGELRLIDTVGLDRLIREQREGKQKVSPQKREEILLNQINDSFHVLRFMERESLYSRNQINAITKGTWEKYNECIKNLDTLETIVSRLEKILQVLQKAEIIEARIETMKNNRDYVENERDGDIEQLQVYREIMKKFKLNEPESAQKLAEQVAKSRDKIKQLQGTLTYHKGRLAEYDRCVSVLNRIDWENGRDNKEIIDAYESIRKQGEKEAEQTEARRNKRKVAER